MNRGSIGCFALIFLSCGLLMRSTGAAQPDSKGWLLVANKRDQALGIVDLSAGRQIASVPLDGNTGHEVAASPDGKLAFVPIFGSGGVGGPGTDGQIIRVVDVAKRMVVATVDFGKGVRPHEALFGPKDGMLYVTAELDNSVAVIDPRSLQILRKIPTGQAESHMLALSRDGRRGYTSNVGPGTISVLDLTANKVLATIPVAKRAQRIALSADDRWVFTADQDQPRLAVIDTGESKVARWIALPGIAYGTAATPDGKWLLAALPRVSKVAVIDLDSMQVTRVAEVPRSPQEVLIRPDGRAAYVSCDASGQVAELRHSDWTVSRLLPAGGGADGLAWAVAQ